MVLSENILKQAERFARSGSFGLTHFEKCELAKWYKERTGETLNIGCGSCVSKALAMVKRPVVVTQMTVEAPELEPTLDELRQQCTDKGVEWSKFHSAKKLKSMLYGE